MARPGLLLLLLPLVAPVLAEQVLQQVGTEKDGRDDGTDSGQRRRLTEAALSRTLDAIGRGLAYLDTQYQHINLDGVIGTRMLEGQLSVLLKHLLAPAGPTVPVETERHLEELQAQAEALSDRALPYVEAQQADYYHRIGPIIGPGFWRQDHASRDVDPGLRTAPAMPAGQEAMDENDSDACVSELLGTGPDTTSRCRVSRYCWKLMTTPGDRGYSLSHQLFYMQIGEATGCFRPNFQPVVARLSAGFCANMLAMAEDFAAAGFPADRQDLFMELQALCGVSGFRQFFRPAWLDAILGWQWHAGCWGKQEPQGSKAKSSPVDGEVGAARTKREERRLADGCLSHRTAVALAALAQYARYITEDLQTQPNTDF